MVGCRFRALRYIVRLSRNHDVIIAEHVHGINREALVIAILTGSKFVYDGHGNLVDFEPIGCERNSGHLRAGRRLLA